MDTKIDGKDLKGKKNDNEAYISINERFVERESEAQGNINITSML